MIITKSKPCVVLPLNNESQGCRVRFSSGGEVVWELDCQLDFEHPTHFMYPDFTRFLEGEEEAEITVEPDFVLDCCAAPKADFGLPYRPATKYSPAFGWNNDPNGLIRYKGVWHMFYQFNPAGTRWGNMHWGHTVSSDLIHWRDKPIALYPDEFGVMYSGSAVIDERNVSGLGSADDPAMLLFYTAAGSPYTQCMAYTTDGETFVKYDGNPVVPHIAGANRDPKVIWCSEMERWVMALYLDGDEYALLGSDDLISWEQIQTLTIPEENECPDFFPLTADDGCRKWIYIGAHDRYLAGDVKADGSGAFRFVPTQSPRRLYDEKEMGGESLGYAAQTFSSARSGSRERRVRISWIRRQTPQNAPFNMNMSFPYEMKLRKAERGYLLYCEPVEEIALLYTDRGPACRCDIDVASAKNAVAELWGAKIKLPDIPDSDSLTRVTILLDRGQYELFIGRTGCYYSGEAPCENDPALGFRCPGAEVSAWGIKALRPIR